MSDHDFDPDRDSDIRTLLRRHAVPPVHDVDWPGLHSRITADAEPLLARVRSGTAGIRAGAQQTAWWQLLAAWSARGIPVAATAAAAAILLIATGALQRPEPAARAGSAYITLEEELAYGSAALIAAGNDSDAVLDALLFYDEAAR